MCIRARYQIGRLSAHAGQGHQLLQRARHLPAVLYEQRLRAGHYVPDVYKRQAPRSNGAGTADGALALAAAVRVVDRVQDVYKRQGL